MTSTSFNVGLKEGTRSSSRVLRPPGGGHTSLFGDETVEVGNKQRHVNTTPEPELEVQNGQNGQNGGNDQPIQEKLEVTPPPEVQEKNPPKPTQEAPKMEPPKRVRVPPDPTGQRQSSLGGMEPPRHGPHLLGKLFGKLRGSDHHRMTSDKQSITTILSKSTTGSETNKIEETEVDSEPGLSSEDMKEEGPNIDLRYGGQCLTVEQLPEFCEQLHRLLEVIRNIQSYAKVTGEYPSELERRLYEEAQEVASLTAEVRNARDVVARTRMQRRAVRAQRKQITANLTVLRETETRELESTIRLSDRKLYRSWEALKDSTDPASFEPLIEEVRNKQSALDCLLRLIECKQATLNKQNSTVPLPPPPPPGQNTEQNGTAGSRKRLEASRRGSYKRRRKEARSVPLSSEPSHHEPTTVNAPESSSRYRVGSAGAVTLTPLEISSRGSVRDIVFFTTT